jgi:FkbM family methyltransferase
MYDFQLELEQLDQNLQPFLRPGFFFVNIGANDGVVADPIYPFIAKYGWRGIAVEPVPYVFEQLRQNYAGFDVILENAAVSNQQESFWYIAEGSGTVDYIAQGMGSLDKDRLLGTIQANRFLANVSSPKAPYPDDLPPPVGISDEHEGPLIADDMEDYVTELEIRCYSFGELMQKHAVERVDFINIDVEGRDHEVFCSIDFDRYQPSVLCLELMGLPEGHPEDIRGRLDDLGYEKVQQFTIFSEVYVRRSG